MNFLIIVLAIGAEFTLARLGRMRSRRWSSDWAAWLAGIFGRFVWWRSWIAALLTIAIPVVAIALMFALVESSSALFANVLSLFVLLAMLGPEDLGSEMEHYRAHLAAGEFTRVPAFIIAAQGTDLGPPTGDGEFDATRVELAALALAAERAWFQPLFWFFVAGPAGAVLYRLCANLRAIEFAEPGVDRALANIREALEWLPARLTTVALGIAGTLVPSLDTMRSVGLFSFANSSEMVARSALAAADNGRIHELMSGNIRIYRINMMFALLQRALIVWLVLYAVGVIML